MTEVRYACWGALVILLWISIAIFRVEQTKLKEAQEEHESETTLHAVHEECRTEAMLHGFKVVFTEEGCYILDGVDVVRSYTITTGEAP